MKIHSVFFIIELVKTVFLMLNVNIILTEHKRQRFMAFQLYIFNGDATILISIEPFLFLLSLIKIFLYS